MCKNFFVPNEAAYRCAALNLLHAADPLVLELDVVVDGVVLVQRLQQDCRII